MDSVTHRCILVFFGVSQTIQLLNKIINMLIPAFSNKITNVTWKMRLGMLFVFNGPQVPSGGIWRVGIHMGSLVHFQAFLHPAPTAAFNLSEL